jgi:hypothetical protein
VARRSARTDPSYYVQLGDELRGAVRGRPHGLDFFNLDEGPVTLTFPASLSADSYADLKDHLDLFLRKAKRQADKGAAQRPDDK